MKEQLELLVAKKIMAVIAPNNRANLSRLDILNSIDSTNTYLLERQNKSFLSKKESGWACFAEEQTQGRGRRGREWFSPYATNIYCSLAWSFPSSFVGLSALGLVCAVLLLQTLKNIGLQQGLGLKWPNDILFSGRKLAGILLENRVSPQQNWVVLGIGLNLSLPAEKNREWIGVEEALGKTVSRNDLAGQLLDQLLMGLPLFEAQGLKPFLPLAREHDSLLQKEVSIYTPALTITGLAQGLNERGELMVLDGDGHCHHFCYGEVSVRLA